MEKSPVMCKLCTWSGSTPGQGSGVVKRLLPASWWLEGVPVGRDLVIALILGPETLPSVMDCKYGEVVSDFFFIFLYLAFSSKEVKPFQYDLSQRSPLLIWESIQASNIAVAWLGFPLDCRVAFCQVAAGTLHGAFSGVCITSFYSMQACSAETNFTQFDHISKAVSFPKLKLRLIRNSFVTLFCNRLVKFSCVCPQNHYCLLFIERFFNCRKPHKLIIHFN